MNHRALLPLLLVAGCAADSTGPDDRDTGVGQILFVRKDHDVINGYQVVGRLFQTTDAQFHASPAEETPGTPGRPAVSRDGRWLTWRDEPGKIWVADRRSGSRQGITPVFHFDRHPSFSPDGSRLVLMRSYGGWETMITVARDGSDAQTVLPMAPPLGGWPDWSPDGEWIVWVRTVPTNATQVELMRIDGSERHPISGETQITESVLREPIWSPDGNRIAYIERNLDGTGALYVVNIEGAILAQLHLPTGIDAERPAWSPDSRTLAYCAPASLIIGTDVRNEITLWHYLEGTTEVISRPDVSDCFPTWGR
jgi:Tol biopolymer transport system component